MNAFNEGANSHGSDDARSELLALNASLHTNGAPYQVFGPPVRKTPVGFLVARRTELCTLGLHRHFLSEASFSELGVESLLLGQDVVCEDRGDRIQYTPRSAALHAAFKVNAKNRKPVRVVRPAGARTGGGERSKSYRYDGVYTVVPGVPAGAVGIGAGAASSSAASGVGGGADENRQSNEGSGSAAPAPIERVLLLRLPDQAPLPPGVGNAGRGGACEEGASEPLKLYAEVRLAPPVHSLPEAAEQALLYGPSGPSPSACSSSAATSAAVGALTVGEAYKKLRAAREALLSSLTPQDAYALVKRSAARQVRLRSGLEMHEGARS